MKTLLEVSSLLEAVRWHNNRSFQARCPAHDDRQASLTVSEADNGGIVLHCHAGCVTDDVLRAIGLSYADITPEKKPAVSDRFDFRNITATYYYGSSLRKIRDGEKHFLWQHKESDGSWKAGRGNEPHVLYRAGYPDQRVYICEGEKDSDNVAKKLGLFAVSSENGAGTTGKKWYSGYNDELRGRDCILLPDNDAVGADFMQHVAAQLKDCAQTVKVLELTRIWPELPAKGDISDVIDHFGAGKTRELLQQLEAATPCWKPSTAVVTREGAVPADAADGVGLELDPKGKPLKTIQNFLQIMLSEPSYNRIHYNLMTGRPEVHDGDRKRNWTDTDEAESRAFIESKYRIYQDAKHGDALRMLFRQREYNPLMDLVETFTWDGENRCEIFLPAILKADDSPYVREVSRLIFAGGINRLYEPGCKFDDVPVLVGAQGSGKSTIVNWLALNDDYYAITKNMSGDQKSIEILQGAWMIEIPELAAFRAADIESLKAFITVRADRYRLPFDRNVSTLPRRCIFLGTTNNASFLTDKSGNRRFYPVTVNSNGYELFRYQTEVRDYISQCWAEARERYKGGAMPPVANPELIVAYREAQEAAMEDDWRVGIIEQYLTRLNPGDFVCVKELYKRALYPESSSEPSPKDSREIGQIMDGLKTVTKVGLKHTEMYGRQRCWAKSVP